jgi:hypothetical protein
VLDVYLRCYTAICPPPDKSKAPEQQGDPLKKSDKVNDAEAAAEP